jgi:hypothetical protein
MKRLPLRSITINPRQRSKAGTMPDGLQAAESAKSPANMDQ